MPATLYLRPQPRAFFLLTETHALIFRQPDSKETKASRTVVVAEFLPIEEVDVRGLVRASRTRTVEGVLGVTSVPTGELDDCTGISPTTNISRAITSPRDLSHPPCICIAASASATVFKPPARPGGIGRIPLTVIFILGSTRVRSCLQHAQRIRSGRSISTHRLQCPVDHAVTGRSAGRRQSM
jgi:hypothetical protein